MTVCVCSWENETVPTLVANPYAWNRIANMLFGEWHQCTLTDLVDSGPEAISLHCSSAFPSLDPCSLPSFASLLSHQFPPITAVEAPAGVGFSYSRTASDYNTNDNKTADDNFAFLLNWFKAYPEYAQNDFYLR